jgi:hypothetical protein
MSAENATMEILIPNQSKVKDKPLKQTSHALSHMIDTRVCRQSDKFTCIGLYVSEGCEEISRKSGETTARCCTKCPGTIEHRRHLTKTGVRNDSTQKVERLRKKNMVITYT